MISIRRAVLGLIPRSLVTQTVLVLLVGLTVSHVLSLVVHSTERTDLVTVLTDRAMVHRIEEVTRLLQETPREWHERIVHIANSPSLQISLSSESVLGQPEDASWRADVIRHLLASLAKSDDEVIVRFVDSSDHQADSIKHDLSRPFALPEKSAVNSDEIARCLRASVDLADGQWVNFDIPIPAAEPLLSSRALLSTALMTVAVALMSLWVVRRTTRPLTAFAEAAERLGRDVNVPPLPESGPSEIRRAVRAFNHMQLRLRRMLEDRARMIAAISHDMRTPLTLLRLRAEYVEDERERQKTMQTLDEMEAMIASTLAFAREDGEHEERRTVDLTALVGSICDDMKDAGLQVDFEARPAIRFRCRPLALKRAVTNVLDNAVKYGGAAHVRVRADDTNIEIGIEDEGPGIPEGEVEKVFSPFYRLEGSRNRETGGAGLGLSLARTVVHTHGGEIRLANREEGGLRVTILLPQ